jgi:acetyltransferase-like isoleucine patch superfamily enzyme
MGLPIFKMATIGLLPSPLKIFYYRLRGAKIGKNVTIGFFSVLNGESIEIGDNASIGVLSFINAKKIKIGKRTKINSMVAIDTGEFVVKNDAVIMEQVVIGGMLTPRSKITIGNNVKIFPYSFLNPTEEIIIEDDVGIGGANYIFTHGSWQSKIDGFPVSFGPVKIKKGVWLPWRVFIMPNVTIDEYATIGAGSIITKDLPAFSLAAGSPAKVLRTGAEYIKQYNDEQKFQIMTEIFEDYADYLTYLNLEDVNIKKDMNVVQLTTNKFSIYLVTKETLKTQESLLKPNDVIISMHTISNEIRNKFNDSKINWFDIEKKETFYNENFSWNTTKDFLSRYGIRFYTFPD